MKFDEKIDEDFQIKIKQKLNEIYPNTDLSDLFIRLSKENEKVIVINSQNFSMKDLKTEDIKKFEKDLNIKYIATTLINNQIQTRYLIKEDI